MPQASIHVSIIIDHISPSCTWFLASGASQGFQEKGMKEHAKSSEDGGTNDCKAMK